MFYTLLNFHSFFFAQCFIKERHYWYEILRFIRTLYESIKEGSLIYTLLLKVELMLLLLLLFTVNEYYK